MTNSKSIERILCEYNLHSSDSWLYVDRKTDWTITRRIESNTLYALEKI